MLARAAGFNAGFALATNIDAVRKNPDTGPILDAIREWESARRRGAFSSAQRELLKNPKHEFHLEAVGDRLWKLYPYHESHTYRHERTVRQPGEPVSSLWEFHNPDQKQALQFKLRVVGDSGMVVNPKFELDRSATVVFPVELTLGQTLLCEGTTTARVYDAKGRQVRAVEATALIPAVQSGKHEIRFECGFSGRMSTAVHVTFRTRGDAEKMQGK
jgi:hypothetical protein